MNTTDRSLAPKVIVTAFARAAAAPRSVSPAAARKHRVVKSLPLPATAEHWLNLLLWITSLAALWICFHSVLTP